MAQYPAPASANNDTLLTLLFTAGLTIVAALVLPQLGLNDQMTGAVSPVIGGIPAAVRVSAQRRRAATGGRGTSPALVMALIALGLLIVDSIFGAIIAEVITDDTLYGPSYDASTGRLLTILSAIVLGIGAGAAAKWFGAEPYKWLAITVAVAFATRIVIIMLFLISESIPVSLFFEGSTIGVFLLYNGGIFVASAATAYVLGQQRAKRGQSPYAPVLMPPHVPGAPGQAAPPAYPAPGVPAGPGYTAPAPTSAPVALTPAGWYPDPHAPGFVRYWDGARWTQHQHRM